MKKVILITLTLLSFQSNNVTAQIIYRPRVNQTLLSTTSGQKRLERVASKFNKFSVPYVDIARSPVNSTILNAISNNSYKTKTYPDGSKAHYNIVRKGDNEYTANPQITPGIKDNTTQNGEKVIIDNGNQICNTITKNYTVTSMDQDMLNSSALSNISLGSVYNLSDLRDGNYKPLFDNRSPVLLQMSEKSTDPILITNPVPTNLNQQVETLRGQPFAGQPQSDGQYLMSSLVTSSSDFELAIGASYTGWGMTLADQFGYKRGKNKATFLLDYTNPVYSIAATAQNVQLFNAGDIRNNDASLVYVSKITYGVRLMVFFETDEDVSTITNNFKGSGWGASLAVDASLIERSKNIKFQTYLYGNRSPLQTYVGLDGEDGLIKGSNRLIQQIVSTTPYIPMVLGKPISYSLRFVSDNAIAATTCSVLNSPDYVCNLNPDRAQDFRIWISGVTQGNFAAVGWSDIEVFDRNRNSLGAFTMVDGTIDGTKATEINAGRGQVKLANIGYSEAPNKGGTIPKISKEDREGGIVRIWLWFKSGDYGFHCRDAVQNGQEQHSPVPAHNGRDMNYIDVPLKDFMMPDGETTTWHNKIISFYTDQTTPGQLSLSFGGEFK